jgi:nicotinamidase/pyrazinamidase
MEVRNMQKSELLEKINPQDACFFDVDTQFDFMMPQGNLYVPGAIELVENLQSLFKLAREKSIQIISTADAHDKDDPEFEQFPPHCVEGTPGQRKIGSTLLGDAVTIGYEPEDVKAKISAPQIILDKQTFDAFSNPNINELLSILDKKIFIVFGVATDYCVRSAALGLSSKGYKVILVTDAIKPVSEENESKALSEMCRAGVRFAKTEEVKASLA